ncbi:MAG: hypothetical protein ACKVIW_17125, partial [bacterium]
MIRLTLIAALLAPAALFAQETQAFDAKLVEVALEYAEKIETATEDLNTARTRIAEDKIPRLNQLRATEDRILQARADMDRQRIVAGNFEANRARREQEADAQRLKISYFATSAAEGLTTWRNTSGALGLGDWSTTIDNLRSKL